jgi:hypothetical protein
MSCKPAIVFIIVDRNYGSQLANLPPDEPVWIIDTPTNRAVAQNSWTTRQNGVHGNGVTVFTSPAASAKDCVIHQLDTIDLHHGIYSADPPYAGFQIVGTEPTTRLTGELAAYGLTEITATNNGFRATRPD